VPGRPFTEALLADRPLVAIGTDAVAVASAAKAATVCSRPSDLVAAVARSMTTDAAAGRAAARELAFAPNGGRDDERAAGALLEVLARQRAPLSVA